ncbi:MAG: tyrosine-type recombinase/integrase, partial [Caldilineaceae bacterium]
MPKPLKNGAWDINIQVDGQRVHKRLPPGTTARDAKQYEADLRSSLKHNAAPVVAGDPRLTECMGLYMAHLNTLRSPETAMHHAVRIGPWVEMYRASQARQCAAHIKQDMQAHYRPATINRSLGTLR